MKTDLFQSCGHCCIFQICWHIECSTFTASLFKIWNSSTGIPSPSLAFFVVMLSKAHLTSHSWLSGSRWVKTPLWLSGSWRSFLYSSSLYSCHLFLYLLLLLGAYHFCPLLSPFLHEMFPWYLWFSWRDLSFSPFCCFPLFLCIDCWGRLSYLSWLFLELCFQWEYLSFSPLLFTSLLFTAICKAPSENHFAFLHFFSMGMVLIPVSCTMSRSSIHSSSGSLSDLVP